MEPKIKVRVSYNSGKLKPLALVLNEAVEGHSVTVQSEQFAVKALLPFSVMIQSASLYLFEKFVLDPLVGPFADKWEKQIRSYLESKRLLNVVIRLEDSGFLVECSVFLNSEASATIWQWIKEAILLLQKEGLRERISKIRISTDDDGKLTVIGYVGEKPFYSLDLEGQKVIKVKSV